MAEGVYVKVGTTIIDYFDYSTGSLSDGDFTKEVDKNGVAGSTTGITISYIGGRRYAVSISGTTGFQSAVGSYNLTIYRTSTPDDRWQTIFRVTNDGTASGSTGAASFTATVGNGRITDGATALAGATVYINRPSGGGLYAAITTDASGLWGPVYFDGNGTWSVTVQKSGYTVGGGSIVVSGATATGPGADIALSAAASSGTTLSALLAYARRMYRDRTSTKTDTELTQAINEALLWISSEHLWPWYHTLGRIDIKAVYTTGTVALTSGSAVCTLSGGVFPSWSADADIYINGMYHPVLSRDSDTQITLVNAWAEASASFSYQLAQTEYDLPTDCMRLDKITSTTEWVWGPDPVARYTLEEARSRWRITAQQPPRLWSIIRNQVVVWPMPSTDKMINLLYFRRPTDLISPTDDADWDPNLISLLHRAIDYQVAIRGDCVAGSKDECYKVLREDLARAISQDRTAPTRRPGLATSGYDGDRIFGATISS